MTDEECQGCMSRVLERADKKEDERQEREAYVQSDEYPRSKIQHYKRQELQQLETHLQDLRNQNNGIFAGGYTGPAVMSHKAELDRIEALGVKKRAEIEERYKETPENLERIRKQAIVDDERYEETLRSNRLMNNAGGGPLIPRVGGAAARHAMAHGGGFNHRGTYAGGVWR